MDEDYYEYITKFFGRWAPAYDVVDILISGIRDKVVDVTNTRSGSKILDVATGTGKQAFAFARKDYDVTGIDLSEDMLKVATNKNKYRNASFIIADAVKMPVEDKYFDVSCVSFGLHDMPSSIRERVLQEMVRVTKPQGSLVVVDYALPRNKVGRYLIYHSIKSYESKYYPEFIKVDLRALLGRLAIEIVNEFPIMFGAGRILQARALLDRHYRNVRL